MTTAHTAAVVSCSNGAFGASGCGRCAVPACASANARSAASDSPSRGTGGSASAGASAPRASLLITTHGGVQLQASELREAKAYSRRVGEGRTPSAHESFTSAVTHFDAFE
jgi:hypothetical protein